MKNITMWMLGFSEGVLKAILRMKKYAQSFIWGNHPEHSIERERDEKCEKEVKT
jgi:hypothetical protein